MRCKAGIIGFCQCSFGIKKEWPEPSADFKTVFNPFSQKAFKIKEVWLSAAIMKWRHFLFKERQLVEIWSKKEIFSVKMGVHEGKFDELSSPFNFLLIIFNDQPSTA